MVEELRQKIADVICEWSEQEAETNKYLESAAIYERLMSQGVHVPDRATSTVLLKLAGG